MKAITDCFVLVAPDCPVTIAVVPTTKGMKRTVPALQYGLLRARPYVFTLEDLLFETHILRAGMTRSEVAGRGAEIRAALFAKPQACMRTSALPKRYGWGVHYDGRGRLALYAVESEEYQRFASGMLAGIEVVAAMRSKRPA